MKKKLIALIVAGELLIFSGVVLGYYHPVAGSIFEIIGSNSRGSQPASF